MEQKENEDFDDKPISFEESVREVFVREEEDDPYQDNVVEPYLREMAVQKLEDYQRYND